MTKVTVVVPTFNKAAFIKHTLASVYAQTFKDWQLLVIDDGSTDETVSIVRRCIDPNRTQVITRKNNAGICHVLNDALERIQTKYFIQLDGDDWIEPDTVQVLFKTMERQPATTALAYANTCHWHEKDGHFYVHKLVKHRPFQDRYDFAVYDPMVQPRFYRSKSVKRVGGWEIDDLTKGRMMEDRRMLLRLLDDHTFTYVDRNLYHFRYHQHNLSHDRNAAVYNKLRLLYTQKALKRWGNHYQAHAVGPSDLWQSIRLVPISQRRE